MISRRIIRVKVLQILYAFYIAPDKSLERSEKELLFSLQKTYDLYHYIFLLLVEMADFAEKRVESGKNKYQPSEADLNPNTKFIDSKLIRLIRNNRDLNSYLKSRKLSWVNHPELIKKLFNWLTETDFYRGYMNSSENSVGEDKKFVRKLLKNIIFESEALYDVLEEQSIYWNDDVDFIISMVQKTMKSFSETSGEDYPLFPMYKDDTDRQFALQLLHKSVLRHEENLEIIKTHTQNWDIERIAFVDTLILEMAITEFVHFQNIPTKVTLNEYIELSKFYSTEKSRNFINGILDKSLKRLKQEKKIHKTGRGLIGEEPEKKQAE